MSPHVPCECVGQTQEREKSANSQVDCTQTCCYEKTMFKICLTNDLVTFYLHQHLDYDVSLSSHKFLIDAVIFPLSL